MARAPRRLDYDPDGEFIVRRKTTVAGLTFEAGDIFDKTLVTRRRLRQMFDQRVIVRPLFAEPRLQREPVDEDPSTLPPIPEDWETMHWTQRRKLAAEISGGEIPNNETAVSIIAKELERRGQHS